MRLDGDTLNLVMIIEELRALTLKDSPLQFASDLKKKGLDLSNLSEKEVSENNLGCVPIMDDTRPEESYLFKNTQLYPLLQLEESLFENKLYYMDYDTFCDVMVGVPSDEEDEEYPIDSVIVRAFNSSNGIGEDEKYMSGFLVSDRHSTLLIADGRVSIVANALFEEEEPLWDDIDIPDSDLFESLSQEERCEIEKERIEALEQDIFKNSWVSKIKHLEFVGEFPMDRYSAKDSDYALYNYLKERNRYTKSIDTDKTKAHYKIIEVRQSTQEVYCEEYHSQIKTDDGWVNPFVLLNIDEFVGRILMGKAWVDNPSMLKRCFERVK